MDPRSSPGLATRGRALIFAVFVVGAGQLSTRCAGTHAAAGVTDAGPRDATSDAAGPDAAGADATPGDAAVDPGPTVDPDSGEGGAEASLPPDCVFEQSDFDGCNLR
jgi:hypothetical protein